MDWRGPDWSVPLERPAVMGVLNVTPDSFSDGGELDSVDAAVLRGLEMAKQGAAVIDVGGESTRPGAEPVAPADELDRVLPVVEGLASQLDVPVSIDTRNASTAGACLEAGASIVNDVTAGTHDERMLAAVAAAGAGIVLMHMRGEPRTMQAEPVYDDVVEDVAAYLRSRMNAALEAGVPRERICIDPGIGFGKTQTHNVALLRGLDRFTALGRPVLVGHSRKSLVGHLTGRPVDQRLAGSLAVAAFALTRGANVLRAHDVPETVDVVAAIGGLTGGVSP